MARSSRMMRGLMSFFIGLKSCSRSLFKNTAQPAKRHILMKNGNETRDVLGDSRKRYRARKQR